MIRIVYSRDIIHVESGDCSRKSHKLTCLIKSNSFVIDVCDMGIPTEEILFHVHWRVIQLQDSELNILANNSKCLFRILQQILSLGSFEEVINQDSSNFSDHLFSSLSG